MGTLTQLNAYSVGTIEVTDLRNAGIKLLPARAPGSQFNFTGSLSFTIFRDVEIIEIIKPDTANVKLEVDISAYYGEGATVDWDTVPAGCTVTNVDGVYTIDGIDTIATWDIVKDPTITRLSTGDFYYTVTIIYTTPTGVKREEYLVGRILAEANITSAFTISVTPRMDGFLAADLSSEFAIEATPVPTINIVEAEADLSAAFSLTAELFEVTLALRADAFSANVELLVPFDVNNEFADLSDNAITPTVGAASSISATQVKWTSSPDYAASYLGAQGLGAALTYTLPTPIPSSASGTYVVETWVYAGDGTSNNNWALSSADVNGRWLFGINNSSSISFASENNIGVDASPPNEWHHIAIVCDGGTKRFYLDAVYKGAWVSSNTGFSVLHVGQQSAADSNDYRGHLQDLRVTIGSVRGYTGTNAASANFTLPSSLVETL